MRAFRYATSNPCRVPTARYPLTSSLPAIEMAGYYCLMPTASILRTALKIKDSKNVEQSPLKKQLYIIHYQLYIIHYQLYIIRFVAV